MLSLDLFHAMRVFVRVVETGGFTNAALSLQIPRTSASSAIQQLEGHLGVRLLQRTTRKVSLTPDGALYYERCLQLLADIEETEALFRQAGSRPKGKLKIDLPGRLARLVIVPALPDFFERYPEIELILGVTDRPIDLVQEGVDCVVRVGELNDSSLIARRLGRLAQGNYASPGYLAKHGTPTSLDALQQHLAVHFASPLSGKMVDWEYLENGELKQLPMHSRVTANNAETYIACALAGLGLIQIPAYDAQAYVQQGRLVEVLPQWTAAPMPISLLYPHRRHRSQRLLVFVDWLAALLAERNLLGH